MSKFNKIESVNYYTGEKREIAVLIPKNIRSLLDVGCGEGLFGKYLKKSNKNLEVWGIEPVVEVAKNAKKNLDNVLVGNIEDSFGIINKKKFDVVTYNDVLEHLVDPWTILDNTKKILNNDGLVIVSLPNVRFVNNLLHIIFKKDFEYEDAGIRDRTHLRFFTKKSMIRMFEDTGYEILDIHGTNPTEGLKFKVLNILTFGYFRDTQYLQFAVVAKAVN
jgi:2-polyprenyl-3-methyl-5-hydroxy-6-metoxy-1,4-benzoquinol methylase